MRFAKLLVLAFAVFALLMMIGAGPGTRFGLWQYGNGIRILAATTIGGAVVAAIAVILIVLSSLARWRSSRTLPVVSLVIAIVAVLPPVLLLAKAKSVPPIHDITTDMADPPVFVSLKSARMASPNGAAYGGEEVAKQQAAAYPDVKPLMVKGDVASATQRAAEAGRALGWELVAMDPAGGTVEATDTSAWFGFKDDIVVRVRPDPSGMSRVDVRSVSRVGRSDIGANAARIREFLARLA